MAHQPIPVSKWLPTIHPSFDTYAPLLADFGYDDSRILAAVDIEDLQRDLETIGVKLPHCRLLVKAVKQMKDQDSSTDALRPGKELSTTIEVGVVQPNKGRESSVRKRLESYTQKDVNVEHIQQVHAKKYVEKLNKAEALKLSQLESKRAFAASQNIKTEAIHTKQKVQSVVQPAVKKTGTKQKLQAAKERKQQVSGKKAAFARSDSLKADEIAVKHKLKQAINPAVLKTAQDNKLDGAQQRKNEASNRKAAFARSVSPRYIYATTFPASTMFHSAVRSDSLKSDEVYAKNKVQDCIRPAVAKAAIDDKVVQASNRKADVLSKKAAFARSDSLKTAAALERKSSASERQKRLQNENIQRIANAAERKGQQMEKKRAFARSDSQKVEDAKRTGTWVHVTNEDGTTDTAAGERLCQLGTSMSWGMSQ